MRIMRMQEWGREVYINKIPPNLPLPKGGPKFPTLEKGGEGGFYK
jgi:hypothetical protein